ncbi:hypothetical protein GGX14DRAFT_562383 [Mycena pura]|uniref:Uncharacterized protein n=1 Tax=Mycena pura TaxID=153505 RepID=A0AAD6VKX0_9AGAR|nr:hypothetical protein GGX14DRAFT_562383 [Mycena pura]
MSYKIREKVQTKHSNNPTFNRIHRSTGSLGVSTFAHLPSSAIVVHISDNVVDSDERVVEVSEKLFTRITTFKDLVSEKTGVIRMVTVLTTVQRKDSANTNVLEVEEDGVDD